MEDQEDLASNSARYIVKKPLRPQSMAMIAQQRLIEILDKVWDSFFSDVILNDVPDELSRLDLYYKTSIESHKVPEIKKRGQGPTY